MKRMTPHPSEIFDLAKAADLCNTEFTHEGSGIAYADLAHFRNVTVEAIKFLSQFDCLVVAFGIPSLDVDLAEAIAAWHSVCFVRFQHLADLTPDVARTLSTYPHNYHFPDLTHLSAEVASELARSAGSLDFDSLSILTAEVANVLAGSCADLEFLLPEEPSREAAKWLVRHKGSRLHLSLKRRPSQRFIETICLVPGKTFNVSYPESGDNMLWMVTIADLRSSTAVELEVGDA